MLEEGKKIELNAIAYHTGGGATNAAVSFKRLGFDVESFFKIGSDPQGEFILKDLRSAGIALPMIAKSSDTPTALSIILPCPSGDRTILAYRGANRTLQENELPLQAIEQCDQLYVTSLSSHAAALIIPITQHAKQHGKRVAVNPGSSQLEAGADYVRQALPNIDILILNSYEAELLMRSLEQTTKFTIPEFMRIVAKRGPKIVVVTDGANGVYVATNNILFFHPSIKVQPVSSVGAGDAFGSCFVGCLALGKSVEDAIRCGIINAASVITHVGAKTGLLTMEHLEQQLKSVDPKLLKRL